MSAPTARHDLRCGVFQAGSCSCRDSQGFTRREPATVVPLSPYRARACPVCEQPAVFQVGPDDVACIAHAGPVLAHLFEAGWDGWLPIAVTPLNPSGDH